MRRSVSWSFLVFCYSAMVSSVFGQPCADIKPLVCSLSGFNPDPTSTYTRPPEPCTAAPDAQKQKIQDAFSLAPDKVKLELCRLKAIFVVPITDADYNWGVWENIEDPNQVPEGEKPNSYVAVRADVLDQTLQAQEKKWLDGTLKNAKGLRDQITVDVPSTLTDENSRKLAILSVFAHEIGHIKWYRDNMASSLACYWDSFIEGSWFKNGLGPYFQRKWTEFNETYGIIHKPESGNTVPSPHENFTAPGRFLRILGRGNPGGFATVLAAVSPEEDFVESYRIAVLKNTTIGLFALTLNLPGTANDVNLLQEPNPNTTINNKLTCVTSLVTP